MAHSVYVLLPADVDWEPVSGTTTQSTRPIRWYLRQRMPEAATQTAVLIEDDGAQSDRVVAQVVERATELGGMAVDAQTQEPIAPVSHDVPH